MIKRDLTARLRKVASQFPAVTLTGPRQSGKSTLCKAVFSHLPYANLESPDVRAYATEDPRGFLSDHAAGAVIDEIQRAPELPSYLQGIIDDDPKPGRWILTGSQNLAISGAVSQSLAGRTAIVNLLPLTHNEVQRFKNHPTTLDEIMLTGGYPRILDVGIDPSEWASSFMGTYIERDVRTISNVGDLVAFQKFMELCAGRTSQLLNYSSLAVDASISQPTAKAWMSVLEASYVAFRLPSFSANIRKRLVRMPKLHFFDTGLVCWLLGIRTAEHLRLHPLRGAIFETWVVSEIIKHRINASETRNMYHYRDQNQVEADLVIDRGDRLSLVEVKAGQTAASNLFSTARRVSEVLRQIRPCDATVVYGGDLSQKRREVALIPWSAIYEQHWT